MDNRPVVQLLLRTRRSQIIQVVQATCRDRGTYHQRLQLARRDRVHWETQPCGLNSIQGPMCWVQPWSQLRLVGRTRKNSQEKSCQTDKHLFSIIMIVLCMYYRSTVHKTFFSKFLLAAQIALILVLKQTTHLKESNDLHFTLVWVSKSYKKPNWTLT